MQDERLVVGDYASRGKDGGENPCVMGCAHLYLGSVFVLGEGGAGGGRIESRLAVSAVLTQFRSGVASDPRGRLIEALQHASGVLHHRSMTGQAFGRAYARCLVVLVRRGRLYAARVGNIDLGLLVGKRPLLRVFGSHDDEPLLGQSPSPDVEILEQEVVLSKGDRFLLTNQSLFTAVPLDEISRITGALVPAVAARRLVELVERASDSRHVSLQIVQAGAQVAVDESPQPTRRGSELDLAAYLPDRLPATPRATDAAAAEPQVQPTLRPFEARAPVVPEFKVNLPPVRPTPPAQVLPQAFQGAPWAHDESGPRLMPPMELADADSTRREPRVNARWAGGVALVAVLAIVFSLAFPRPQRPDGDAPTPLDSTGADWLSAATDVAATSSTRGVVEGPTPALESPTTAETDSPAPSTEQETGGAPVARTFWHRVADMLASGTTLSGHLVTGLLESADERADRLAEARAVVAALEVTPEPALDGAAIDAVPGDETAEPAVAPEAVADAPTPPPVVAMPAPFDLGGPAAAPAADTSAPADAAAPGSTDAAAAPQPKRALARLFMGESDVAAQRVRDYVHRRHAQVDDVLARLDDALSDVPRDQALSVLSKIPSTKPGPKTRKWAAAARRRLTKAD
jgi:hypothetical protein